MYQSLWRHAFQKTVVVDEIDDADHGLDGYGY
jgi:hypothetical protein